MFNSIKAGLFNDNVLFYKNSMNLVYTGLLLWLKTSIVDFENHLKYCSKNSKNQILNFYQEF